MFIKVTRVYGIILYMGINLITNFIKAILDMAKFILDGMVFVCYIGDLGWFKKGIKIGIYFKCSVCRYSYKWS